MRAPSPPLLVVVVLLGACGRPVDDANNQAPLAAAGPDRTALVGEAVALDGSSSSDADGTLVAHRWELGDGATAEGSKVSHAWAAAGGYVVALTVVDDDGASARDTLVVQVAEALPVARITTSVASAVVGQEVSFDGSGSSGPSPLASWAWSFGDGATASGPLVSHGFGAAGTFPVRLTVTDEDGLVASTDLSFGVSPPDVAGTWDVVADAFSCANYEAPFPDDVLVVSQAGADVTAEGGNGRTYVGTLDGANLVMSGDVLLDTGACGSTSVHVVMQGTLGGAGSLAGRATGFFDLGIGCQCSAAWDVVATRR